MTGSPLVSARRPAPVHYPDSDGQPMAENMTQFRWIVTIKENLDALLPDLVAGDLFWYPNEGDNRTRVAPDVLVGLGRPKGERSSYMQWHEGGMPPAVIFEVLSPGNRTAEMVQKYRFYDHHGVSEYYVFDPDEVALTIYVRQGDHLEEVSFVGGWVSPLLGVRLQLGDDLTLIGPDGSRFLTFAELKQSVDGERLRADTEAQRADAEAQRADAMAAKLRALGIDPDA